MFWKKQARNESAGAAGDSALTRDHVVWAYRLLLDREPESEDVIGPKLAGSHDTRELRNHLMSSDEFRGKNPDAALTSERTVVITELDGPSSPRLFIDLSDHAIGLNILRGRYEPEEIAFVTRLLKPGDVAIDVGAHVGYFSMRMADAVGPSGRVYAFEPLDSNADLLERSVAENSFQERVTVRRAAVGSSPGTASLSYPRETLNSGGAYLVRHGTAPLPNHLVREVPVVALDELDVSRPVRLIKIDAEGAEPQVIRGAARLLREHRPVILSELHPVQLRRASAVTGDEFLRELRDLGYAAHDLEGGPVQCAAEDRIVSVVFAPM